MNDKFQVAWSIDGDMINFELAGLIGKRPLHIYMHQMTYCGCSLLMTVMTLIFASYHSVLLMLCEHFSVFFKLLHYNELQSQFVL